jgi:3-deoxy-D-arabino-heptulosonate 7-phosphate (DAHP) synthase
MIEVHHNPGRALSDGSQAVLPDELAAFVRQLPVLLPLTGRHLAEVRPAAT